MFGYNRSWWFTRKWRWSSYHGLYVDAYYRGFLIHAKIR